MVMPTRNTYRKKAPPGYRWKPVQVKGARPGTLITKHILVKIESAEVPPETIFTAEESIRGAEDRQASMSDSGGTQRLKEDVTTVIKEYEGDTPNTKTTTIKGGLLGDPMEDWAGRGAERDERGMQDWYANMAQAQARVDQGTAAPSQAAIQQQFAAKKRAEEMERRGWIQNRFHPDMRGIPPMPQPTQPARLPLAHGQDDPRIDDGPSLLDTKVLLDPTQAKRRAPPPLKYPPQASGALPTEQPGLHSQMYKDFDPYGGIGTGGGMDDPTWSRAERQASGTVPFNPYKDNVGPMYGGEMANVDLNSLQGLILDNPPGKYGGIQGYDNDGQPFYLSDVIDIGAAGKIKLAKGTIDVSTRVWNRIKSLFKGKKKSEFDAPTSARARAAQSDRTIPAVGEKAAEAVSGATKGASTIKGTSRTRRALSKIAPGRKTELVVAGALSAGLAGELTDNALWNRFKDATAEQLKQYGFLPEQIAEMAKDVGTTLKRAATETTSEWEARIAREKSGKAIRAKGLLDIPDKDARAGTEFFGAGDVAGDTLIPEKAKTPVAAVEDPLKKFWGKYADDPAKRKQKYLDSLSSIWRKAAIMDAIAAATGGESRSPQFVAMMAQRMDAISKFDDEERLHNIFKSVYYNPETGAYNPPKNKVDAYERAIKLGASPAEAKKIFGYQPEPDEALHEWYYKDPVTNEYVTEHVRGKATMPEGDYNWSKGKTPIITETEEIGGTKNERAWNEIKATLGRGGLEGNLDDAIRIYMQYDKVDPIMGFDVKEARSRAEQHIMSTMTGHERKAYTYTPTEGEELSEERLAELRKLGYAYVIVDGKEEALVWRA